MTRQVCARMKRYYSVFGVASSSAALSAFYIVVFTSFFVIETVTGNGALVNGKDIFNISKKQYCPALYYPLLLCFIH